MIPANMTLVKSAIGAYRTACKVNKKEYNPERFTKMLMKKLEKAGLDTSSVKGQLCC